jgi:peptide chain release factor 1
MRELERRFSEIEARMAEGPAADVYVKLASEYSELQPVVTKIRLYEKAQAELADVNTLLTAKDTDREMRDLADMEKPEIEERIEKLEQEMQILLLPKDAADEKSAILEIRAGTGGSTRPRFSPAICSGCMSALRPCKKAGRSRCSRPAKAMPAASRKSSPTVTGRAVRSPS